MGELIIIIFCISMYLAVGVAFYLGTAIKDIKTNRYDYLPKRVIMTWLPELIYQIIKRMLSF